MRNFFNKRQENENENKMSMLSRLADIVDRSSFHALPNTVKSNRIPWKIIYLGSFLSTVIFFMNIYLIKNDSFIYRYLAYETDTIWETVPMSNAPFPAITICNLEVCGFIDYDYTKVMKDFIAAETQRDIEAEKAILARLATDKTKSNLFWAKEIFLVNYDDEKLNKILSDESESIDKMLLSCKFSGELCNSSDFEFFQMGEFQKCFQFNAKRNESRNIHRFNKEYGLKLELFVGEPEKCRSPLATTSGLNIYIHNQTNTPTLDDDTILVEQGTETNIAVDRTFLYRIPEPYSDCINAENAVTHKSHLVKQTLERINMYQQQYCLSLCYQEFLLKYCDCYDHALPNFEPENKTSCPIFVDSTYNCIYVAKKLFYNGRNDAHCPELCPSECEVIIYTSMVSKAMYPSATYEAILNETQSISSKYSDVKLDRKSILALNIYYNHGQFTKIQEKPTTDIERFLCEFGGLLGLFIGAGMLSFIEIFEAILECILFQFDKFQKRRKINSPNKRSTLADKIENTKNK